MYFLTIFKPYEKNIITTKKKSKSNSTFRQLKHLMEKKCIKKCHKPLNEHMKILIVSSKMYDYTKLPNNTKKSNKQQIKWFNKKTN